MRQKHSGKLEVELKNREQELENMLTRQKEVSVRTSIDSFRTEERRCCGPEVAAREQ